MGPPLLTCGEVSLTTHMKPSANMSCSPLDTSKFLVWAEKMGAGGDIDAKLNGSRPKIRLPQAERLLSEFASDLGETLKDYLVFNRSGIPVVLNLGRLQVLTPEALRTWAEQYVVCYTHKFSQSGVVELKQTMSTDHARGVLASVQFMEKLRPLRHVNPVRLPIMRPSGVIELLPEGYDEAAQTLTLPSSLEIESSMSIEEARLEIDDLLSEFCFARDDGRSKSVAISAMLTVFGRGLLPSQSLTPCFLYLANAEGAGKSLLASCAVFPVHGAPKIEAMPERNEELDKRLNANMVEATGYLLFDNVKGHLDFPALEAFTTSTIWKGRLLGHSREVSAEHSTTVLITGNRITISPDQRRRSLICELFMEEERPEERTFRRVLDMPALVGRREELLSALWVVVRHWDKSGRPPSTRTYSGFSRWAETIGGIIECAGWKSPLGSATPLSGGDVDTADIRELASAMKVGTPLKFCEIVDLCRSLGLFEQNLPPSGMLDQNQKSSLGKLLARYHGRLMPGPRRFVVEGKGHARRYVVRTNLE